MLQTFLATKRFLWKKVCLWKVLVSIFFIKKCVSKQIFGKKICWKILRNKKFGNLLVPKNGGRVNPRKGGLDDIVFFWGGAVIPPLQRLVPPILYYPHPWPSLHFFCSAFALIVTTGHGQSFPLQMLVPPPLIYYPIPWLVLVGCRRNHTDK